MELSVVSKRLLSEGEPALHRANEPHKLTVHTVSAIRLCNPLFSLFQEASS
jgi:hypothetical protein